jgi:hypothetical protein
VPKISGQRFLWSGESKRDSATGDWQRALKGVFKEAKISDWHVRACHVKGLPEVEQSCIAGFPAGTKSLCLAPCAEYGA